MLNVRIEQSGKTASLVLEGEMIIDHAEELKNILREALKNVSSLNLNIEAVNKVDLFGLQVLCSAHRFTMKAGKELTLIGEWHEALRDVIAMAGYGSSGACSADTTCPWNDK